MSMRAALLERAQPVRSRIPDIVGWVYATRRVPVIGPFLAWLQLDFAGMLGATSFFVWSLTPSLLPRTWYYQALVTGVTTAVGYAVGVLFGVIIRFLVHRLRPGWRPPRRWVRVSWGAFLAVAAPVVGWYLVASAGWQSELRELMDVASPGPSHYLFILLFSFLLFISLLGLARALRGASRWLGRILARWVPIPVAVVASAVAVAGISVWAWTGLLFPSLIGVANNVFAAINQETMADDHPPEITTHAGGPDSLVTWDSLGRKGREFISGGPTAEEIEEFSGRPALDPVRTYIGMDSAETAAGLASLAVRELERAGGFDRAVLVVVTATGTGWVDDAAADAIEYLHNGDTAVVSIQYSYLPSWISFLAEREQVDIAGEELFDAVYERWLQLPEDDRPELYVYGESFGAVGSASAFDDVDDVTSKVDGALWVGSPRWHPLREEITQNRAPGSLERLPVYENGRSVRFWGGWHEPLDDDAWPRPRVLFLQHASDPVAYWSPELIWSEPTWLQEPPGPDVLPHFNWYPFVTFWQLTADMAVSGLMPEGHAHNYGGELVDAWLHVAPPVYDWPEDDLDDLREMVQSFDLSDDGRLW